MITCSQCQTPLGPGTRFCPNCGLQFENPVPESAPAFKTSATAPAKKKSNPLLLGLVALVGFFVLVGIVGGNQRGANTASQNSADPAVQSAKTEQPQEPQSQVTMANYNSINSGMSYEEVVAILGEEGTELSSNELAGYKTIMYQWKGAGFASNMNAMFQNGKLMQKAQFGLK
jgi:hypothetical protein